MSTQHHAVRRDTHSLRSAGATWALPRPSAVAEAGTSARPAETDPALLALLQEDEGPAPALPRRLAPSRLLRGILLRWRLLALLVLAAGVLGTGIALTIAPRWQAVATLIVSDREALLSVGGGQPYQTREYGIETLMDTLKLPSSLDESLRRAGVPASRTQLAAAVKVNLAQKSDVVNLRVLWNDPEAAAALANHLADVFVERTTRIRTDQAAHDHASFQRQLEDARRRLARIDAEVLAFQQKNKVASFEEETKARLIDLSRLQSEHWSSQGEVEALRLARRDYEATLRAAPATVTATLFRNPLGKRLEEIEWQLKEARTRYTEENPKVIKLREQSAALQAIAADSEFTGGETTRSPNDLRRDLQVKLQDLVTTLRLAEGRETGLASSVVRMEAKIGELAALEKQFRQLEARQVSARELERSLSSKLEEARVAMAAAEPSLQLVERARIPSEAEPSPRRLIVIAAVVLGGLLALGIALTLELLDPRVRCREDLEDFVDGEGPCTEIGRLTGAERDSLPLASPAFRAFRRFANDLSAADTEQARLAIASAGSGDGRSTVAQVIALCLAMRGRRTTLIDADLRESAGPRPYPAAERGLVDVLSRRARADELLQRGAHERLDVLTAGTTAGAIDPVLLLAQPEATQAITAIAARGGRVVVDLPPAGEDEGAFELACACGRVVLVARHGSTPRSHVASLATRFRQRGVRIVGVVVLDVPPERQHPYAGPTAREIVRNEWRRLRALVPRRRGHV